MNRLARSPNGANDFWTAILSSLKALRKTTQFDKTLDIMNASDDFMVKGIAQQLSETYGRPISSAYGKLIN